VLGDQQFNFFASSYAQYRTMSFAYTNLARRLNWAVQAYSQTQFFYGQLSNLLYDPVYAPLIDRDLAEATSTIRGGSAYAIWPFNRYRRMEFFTSVLNYKQQYNDPVLDALSQQYQQEQFGQQILANGWFFPFGANFVQETTIFREFGPLSGNTMRLGYQIAPSIGSSLSRQTVDLDLRKYVRLGTSGLLALRARGFNSWGDSPDFIYFGGNSELRGYDYLEFLGSKAAFMNAELRFPLIEAMLTPLGVMGGIRGVMFAGIGGGSFEGLTDDPSRTGGKYQVFSNKTETFTPLLGTATVLQDNQLGLQSVYGDPVTVSGFRLVDSRASYGLGLETFALGFPIHFDWAWRTTFNKNWEDVRFAGLGGSSEFRKPQFKIWIGYDF
jgi:outer membrane protein assembly factor BamA